MKSNYDFCFLVAMFSNDLCRPLILKFENVSSVKGISGNRYVLDDLFFANSSTKKDNWCFEAPKSWSNPKQDERQQFPNGVFNLGLCKFNSSTFISQPHFLEADPYYLNQFVDGSLKPDARKHQTTLVIGNNNDLYSVSLLGIIKLSRNFFNNNYSYN